MKSKPCVTLSIFLGGAGRASNEQSREMKMINLDADQFNPSF